MRRDLGRVARVALRLRLQALREALHLGFELCDRPLLAVDLVAELENRAVLLGKPGFELVDALLRSLLDQGVPASTVAQALKSMPGIGRNEAYERVLALGRGTPQGP